MVNCGAGCSAGILPVEPTGLSPVGFPIMTVEIAELQNNGQGARWPDPLDGRATIARFDTLALLGSTAFVDRSIARIARKNNWRRVGPARLRDDIAR
jgi:hypothetical protein